MSLWGCCTRTQVRWRTEVACQFDPLFCCSTQLVSPSTLGLALWSRLSACVDCRASWYQYSRLAPIHQLIQWWHIVWKGCGSVHPHHWIGAFLLIQCLLPHGFTLFAWWWYGELKVSLIPLFSHILQNSLLMYWLPKSPWICDGSPYSDNIWVKWLHMVLAVMLPMSRVV